MAGSIWGLDIAHSSITFRVRHLMVTKVVGRFQTWGGALVINDDDFTKSQVELAVDAASIDTRDANRDEHLRSADFFDVAAYPAITFHSTAIADLGDRYAVTGDLAMHGHTRSIVLAVDVSPCVLDPWGGTRRGFSARATVSRRDFGLTWNMALDAGGVLVGDRIDIEIELEALEVVDSKAA